MSDTIDINNNLVVVRYCGVENPSSKSRKRIVINGDVHYDDASIDLCKEDAMKLVGAILFLLAEY